MNKKKYLLVFLTIVFLVLSSYSFYQASSYHKFVNFVNLNNLGTIEVDLSKSGEYQLEFNNKLESIYKLYKVFFILDSKLTSKTEFENLFLKFKGIIRLKDKNGSLINQWDINKNSFQFADVIYKDIYASLHKYEKYVLDVEILQGAPNLEQYNQRIVFNYGIIHERTILKIFKFLSILSSAIFLLFLIIFINTQKS